MYNKEIQMLQELSCKELMDKALQAKLSNRGKQFSLCSIINGKSGQCSENCKFCVQSAHFSTDIPVYPIMKPAEVIPAAEEALRIGAEHFSLVTSGRGLTGKDFEAALDIVSTVHKEVEIKVCASLGILNVEQFTRLREAGLVRYHHNLETSKEFFPNIVSTHTFDERVETIKAAKEAGLEVCAGGIFGLGETEDDRISMAITLRDLEVDSIPINILIPLPGTPLESQEPLSANDILRSISLYRLLVPSVPIRLAAGRETALQDFLSSAFLAGADGMMIGGYLTERGRSPEMDNLFVENIRSVWDLVD